MVMNKEEPQIQQTQHAFLVAWGWFGEHIGLIQALQKVQLHQKRYTHTPQTKVLEFFVANLAGAKHLQDISQSAHPLDLDAAVAAAWGQASWADYSGVSRTLSGLRWEEVRAVVNVLDEISQPFLQAELDLLRKDGKRLHYDGDLTGIPVSNTSETYPNASFGYMDDEIRLGYQAGMVSLVSESYGRWWLSATLLPGETVSCTQAEALVLAAEAKTGLRPKRRTDLLAQRILMFEKQICATQQRQLSQHVAVQTAQQDLEEVCREVQERQQAVAELETKFQEKQRKERPTSQLALARQRFAAIERRQSNRKKDLLMAQQRLEKTQTLSTQQHQELAQMKDRLVRFEQENAANAQPVDADFRLDAGFGTYENIALLIEMGYQIYTKAYNYQLVNALKKRMTPETSWERVGTNAEMVAWQNMPLKHCPYPLDVGLERFYTGKTIKHSALLHFGVDPVTRNPPEWFKHYNGRQTIEAGIKETKQVFYLHKIKVRSEPAIYLQEAFVIFAANFIRLATPWLANQTQAMSQNLKIGKMGIKRQVQVGAHVSAQVIQDSEGKLLMFSEYSVFAGKVLKFPGYSSSRSLR
jgi:hypothetical protein